MDAQALGKHLATLQRLQADGGLTGRIRVSVGRIAAHGGASAAQGATQQVSGYPRLLLGEEHAIELHPLAGLDMIDFPHQIAGAAFVQGEGGHVTGSGETLLKGGWSWLDGHQRVASRC